MASLLRTLPLGVYWPLRAGVVRLPRGNPLRSACLVALRPVIRAHRRRLGERLAEFQPLDAPGMVLGTADSQIAETVFWLGVQGYEGVVAEVWRALCARSRCVLEIGGNIGLFSVIGGLAASGRYTVVEPVPAIAGILRANLRRNGLAERVEVIEAAAISGAEPRDVMLSIPQEAYATPTGSHLVSGVEVSGRAVDRVIEVAGMPMRDLVAGRDLVKIDAEGIEAQLLGDVRDLIAANRPTMVVEVLPEAHRLAAVIVDIARENGYRLSILPEWGRRDIVEVPHASFVADLPQRYNSKDIVLSRDSLPSLA